MCSRAVLYTATYENCESCPRYLEIMGLSDAHLFSVIFHGFLSENWFTATAFKITLKTELGRNDSA